MILSFVTRNPTNGNLELDGQRFRFGGANTPFFARANHTQIDGTLNEAVLMKHTVIRVYDVAMTAGTPGSVQPTIGVFNSNAMEPLDYVMSKCAELGIRVIVPFCEGSQNFYGDGSGYKSWYCKQVGITPDSVSSQFFTDARVVAGFKNFISQFINYTNQYTGVKYKDDPVVLAWETGNELGQWPSNPEWPDYCMAWTEDIATFIKVTCGAKQLVVDGHCGVTVNGIPDVRIASAAHVDIYQGHAYRKYASVGDEVQSGHVAKSFGKSYIIGEYGWNGQSQEFPYLYEGPSYVSICPGVEASTYIDGDMYWELLAPGENWGGWLNYTLHAPGDNPAMIAAVNRLTAHSAFMSSGQIGPATGPAFLSETFTDTSGVLLENHVGEAGVTWSKSSGQTGTLSIQSNRACATAGNAIYQASVIPPSADYQVIGTVRIKSATGNVWVTGRMDPVAQTGYMALFWRYYPQWWEFWRSAAWVLTLRKYVNGVSTDLGTIYPQSVSTERDYDIALIMKGNQISVTWDGAVTILAPVTDSAVSAAGKVGCGGNGMTSTTGYHINSITATVV